MSNNRRYSNRRPDGVDLDAIPATPIPTPPPSLNGTAPKPNDDGVYAMFMKEIISLQDRIKLLEGRASSVEYTIARHDESIAAVDRMGTTMGTKVATLAEQVERFAEGVPAGTPTTSERVMEFFEKMPFGVMFGVEDISANIGVTSSNIYGAARRLAEHGKLASVAIPASGKGGKPRVRYYRPAPESDGAPTT